MTQDEVSEKLGLTGECKRRTMTRYEKGNRNPKDDRTSEIAKILDININAIKKYDYKDPIDLLYTLMWLEELIPKYQKGRWMRVKIKNSDPNKPGKYGYVDVDENNHNFTEIVDEKELDKLIREFANKLAKEDFE